MDLHTRNCSGFDLRIGLGFDMERYSVLVVQPCTWILGSVDFHGRTIASPLVDILGCTLLMEKSISMEIGMNCL